MDKAADLIEKKSGDNPRELYSFLVEAITDEYMKHSTKVWGDRQGQSSFKERHRITVFEASSGDFKLACSAMNVFSPPPPLPQS